MADLTSSPQVPTTPSDPDPNFIKWLQDNAAPIVFLVTSGLLLCRIGHYSSVVIDWTKTKDFTNVLRNVTQSVAFIVGGIWAYFKFSKERTFQQRLIPLVTARFILIGGHDFLIITAQMKNVGRSRLTFD